MPPVEEIARMNTSIIHRGPDDDGILAFENMLFGHVRLSIQDLSIKGRQPMSVDGKYWIIFNGEIYNFKDIRLELSSKGYKFYSDTDTEVILNAYKEWGVESFKKFNGMWCFAILDKEKKEVLISRDRYGIKPCYFSKKNNKITFSSEIKGILSSNAEYKFDNKKFLLADKFKERCFTTEYEDIDIIQPGFYYRINIQNLEIEKKRWWDGLNNIPKIEVSKKKIIEDLKNKLNYAVKLRLISDTKIATSLSGGIDSSIIFTILNSLKNEGTKIDLNPFIVSYKKNKTINEAMRLTQIYKKNPIIVNYNEDDELENLSILFSSIELTTPYASQYSLYKKQNAHGFKVSIDGHGADECLGGYKSDLINFGMYFQNNIAKLYETISNLSDNKFLSSQIKNLGLVSTLRKFDLNLQNQLIPQINKNRYVKNKNTNLIPDSLRNDLIELNNFQLPFQILYLNANYGHMQWLLNKWDKASMAHSVEIRSPFLDWNFFQYALALPGETKIETGKNKSILRESFEKDLPKEIKDIKFKQGLPTTDIKIDAKSLMVIKNIVNSSDFKTSPNWNGKKILKDFNSQPDVNNISEIWKLVRLHLMDRGFKERKKEINLNKIKSKEKFNLLN